MTQYSYSVLWGSPTEQATETHRPFKNNTEARAARDLHYRQLKASGKKVKRWVLNWQMRQYWSMSSSCGESCDVYKLEVLD